jgi:hypothetical protein
MPISLTLAHGDRITVDVVDRNGYPVRRLLEDREEPAHAPVSLAWDGRVDAGGRVMDGRYFVRVTLQGEGRSVTVGPAIVVDTHPPRPVVRALLPGNVVGPEPRRVEVVVNQVSRTHPTFFAVLRTDDGPPHAVATFTGPPGVREVAWDGRVHGAPAPPGLYLFRVSVRDAAGNLGTTPTHVEPGAVPGRPGLTVRAIAAQPPLRPVDAGHRVEVLVDSRGRRYRWSVRRVGSRGAVLRGRSRPRRPLSFRAPGGPSGAYLIRVTSGRWHTTVPLLVQAPRRAAILVVVPAMSWLGRDPVDDPPFDGVPNTLDDGGPVRWPRVFAGRSGLPTGFSRDIAPLLAFLDRNRVRYDLTSDLDLALTTNPRASDRQGVLLAGAERWVTRPLARRLRAYVLEGGRLAAFGADSLRRGVVLRADAAGATGELVRPTQPTPVDPFGARLAPLRRTGQPATLTLLDGDPAFGLLTGILSLAGFSELEESGPPTSGEKLLAGVGQDVTDAERATAAAAGRAPREPRPALTAVGLGKGLVIRVGLPQWTEELGRPDVEQVTLNIADLLRGRTPRIR